MKKINIKIVLLLISLSAVSCSEDFLTLVPESDYSVSGSYKTAADFKLAINAVYAEQQGMFSIATGNWWVQTQLQRSDDTRAGAQFSDGIDTFTDGDNQNGLDGNWYRMWRMIFRCNLILDKIEEVGTFNDQATVDKVKGEAYALRAWCYHTLGNNFGGMPLITRVLTVPETRAIPRSTEAETYAQAEADYTAAIGLLPDAWTGSDAGRISKYAAMAGLARLQMYQGKFPAAKTNLENVVNSGKYDLVPSYIDVFKETSDNGIESVWEIQFTGKSSGEGWYGGSHFIPENSNYLPAGVQGTANGNQFPSLDMLAAYEPGDLRKDVSVRTGLVFGGQVNNNYFITKYTHYNTKPVSRTDWENNFHIIRYADVLLMYAECLNEAGYVANGPAFAALNKVRDRANLADLTSAEVPNQQAFRDAIIQERRVELAFEGHRWTDLKRWGLAETVMNAFFKEQENGNGLYSMKAHQKIYAIPSSELDAYSDTSIMPQNPNY